MVKGCLKPGRMRCSARHPKADTSVVCAKGSPSQFRTRATQQRRLYSITSSARACSIGGTVMPNAFAALRLMTNSNLVGCITGKSAGLAP